MAELQDLIAQLSDDDPDARVQACILLRKAGDPTAIPELARVYQVEDDPVVREAASDALRFFAKQEKGGGGSPALRNVSVLLVISLVVLVALNVVTRMGGGEEAADASTPTVAATAATVPTGRDILMTNYTFWLFDALDDINAMRTDWANGAGSLTCEATLKRPQPFIVQDIDRQTYPDITFVDDFNQALTDLQAVTADYDAACDSPELGTEEQRTAAEASLTDIDNLLNTVVAIALNEATVNPVATIAPPTPVPTATFDVTLTPSPTATVTLVPTLNPNVAPTVRELDRRISNTETELNSLINNKWLIVQAGGVSQFGCTGANFNDPYSEASEELLTQEPDLEAIIVVLNEALVAAQASADLYATNCNNGTLNATIIDQGLGQAVAALSNIELAKSELERLYPQ